MFVGGSFVRTLVASLGIGFVSFAGLSLVINNLIDYFVSQFDNIAVDVLAILELGGMSASISMILSAFLIRVFIFSTQKVLTGRSIKQFMG